MAKRITTAEKLARHAAANLGWCPECAHMHFDHEADAWIVCPSKAEGCTCRLGDGVPGYGWCEECGHAHRDGRRYVVCPMKLRGCTCSHVEGGS